MLLVEMKVVYFKPGDLSERWCYSVSDKVILRKRKSECSQQEWTYGFSMTSTVFFLGITQKMLSSSTFAIRVNLLHRWPSLFLFGSFLPLWCLSTLAKLSFKGFLLIKSNFQRLQNDSKYRDVAPLILPFFSYRRFDHTHSNGKKNCLNANTHNNKYM